VSPVDRSSSHAGRVALVSFVAMIVLAIGLWLAAAYLTDNPSVEVDIGSDRFEIGDAEDLADAIDDDDGVPLFFPDLARFGGPRQRPIVVNHLDDDPLEGWVAFDALVDGCPLEWVADDQQLADTCTGDRYPPSGEGLNQFDVEVDDEGDVIVDLTPDG
jgi:hypothetical protein